MKKKDIVENDKTKIASVISELDQKKNEALQTAWKRVNKVHVHTTEAQTLYHTQHDSTQTYGQLSAHAHMQALRVLWLCFAVSHPPLLLQGLWLHLLHSPPRCHSQVGATRGSDSAGWAGSEGGLQRCVEGHPNWIKWGSEVGIHTGVWFLQLEGCSLVGRLWASLKLDTGLMQNTSML